MQFLCFSLRFAVLAIKTFFPQVRQIERMSIFWPLWIFSHPLDCCFEHAGFKTSSSDQFLSHHIFPREPWPQSSIRTDFHAPWQKHTVKQNHPGRYPEEHHLLVPGWYSPCLRVHPCAGWRHHLAAELGEVCGCACPPKQKQTTFHLSVCVCVCLFAIRVVWRAEMKA